MVVATMQLSSIVVKLPIIVPGRKLHLVQERGGRESGTPIAKVGMFIHYHAPLHLTYGVRGGALVV